MKAILLYGSYSIQIFPLHLDGRAFSCALYENLNRLLSFRVYSLYNLHVFCSCTVRESKNEAGRGGRGRGYGRGRGGGGYNRDAANNENTFSNSGYNRESVPSGPGAFEDGPPKRRFSGGDGDGRPTERRGYGGDGDGRPSERRGYGGPRGSYHGGRRGGFGNGEVGDEERPRRTFERRSGTGRG